MLYYKPFWTQFGYDDFDVKTVRLSKDSYANDKYHQCSKDSTDFLFNNLKRIYRHKNLLIP